MLEIYVDGAARKNPGPAAYAYIIVEQGEIIYKLSKFIGEATNNIAEYQAIINSLQKAKDLTSKHIKLHSDSKLAIQQINGEWKINKTHLRNLNFEVQSLKTHFKSVDFIHIKRENKYIQICDSLCNEILNAKGF